MKTLLSILFFLCLAFYAFSAPNSIFEPLQGGLVGFDFFYDPDTGNSGLGTSSPSKKFSVDGDVWISGNLTVSGINSTGTQQLSGLTGDCDGAGDKIVWDISALAFGCGSDQTGAGGGVYPFTPTLNFGKTMSATTSNIYAIGAGIYASSSSVLGTTSFAGPIIVQGTTTATQASCKFNVTADLTAMIANVAGCSTLSVTSDNTTSTGRSFCLTAGTEGQILFLFADVVGTNEIELVDGASAGCATTFLAGVWPATTAQNQDTLMLMYRLHGTGGAGWYELNRAAN